MTGRKRVWIVVAALSIVFAVGSIVPVSGDGRAVVGEGDDDAPRRKPSFRLGQIEPAALRESSGIVASRAHDGVFWTHNDSGNDPVLYAITRTGKPIAEYPVGAKNDDWEDIAIDGEGHLFIADVGNNQRQRRRVQVIRVDEPDVRAARPGGAEAAAAALRVDSVWQLEYPADPFDCEAMFVYDGRGYLISKQLDGAPAALYRFELTPQREPAVLERIGNLSIRAPVTAADISADGSRLLVLTVIGPYLFQIDGDVARAAKVEPRYSRYLHPQMESACFVPDGVLVTTETREILLFRDEHFSGERKAAN